MRTVEVGANVWIGYNACFLRGVRVGDNSIVGTNAVVTKDVPANAVVGGIPASVIRMREAPEAIALARSRGAGPTRNPSSGAQRNSLPILGFEAGSLGVVGGAA